MVTFLNKIRRYSVKTELLESLEKFVFLFEHSEIFRVHDKPEPSNLAYTSGSLDLHIDLPYQTFIPGVLFNAVTRYFL